MQDIREKRIYALVVVSLMYFFLIAGLASPAYSDELQGKSLLQRLTNFMSTEASTPASTSNSHNAQTLPLPRGTLNIPTESARGGGDVVVVDESALLPDEGPSGTIADIIARPKNATISIYVVREGDTLSSIGELFDVSVNTIMWANSLTKTSKLKIGQTLTILPVTGVKYTVKSGDTLASVAKKFKGDAEEIASFNGLDSEKLAVGDEIIIPDGEVVVPVAPKTKVLSTGNGSASSAQYAGYYLRPVVGGQRSQGIHGYNGVDIAAPAGTPFLASASGEVIVARASGWNGGYGQYIVIRHDNGSQTLYAHASNVIVGIGQAVIRGQVIGYVGSTGRSTGNHLHFEIRNGPRNPF